MFYTGEFQLLKNMQYVASLKVDFDYLRILRESGNIYKKCHQFVDLP